ncbi:MAG TPA: hypothetical protein VGJ07_31580 [Rugosimonospora sp.]
MTAQTPVSEQDGARIGLGRSNASTVVLVLAFLVIVVVVSVHGAWTSAQTSARVLGFGLGAVFTAPLVLMLVKLPRLLRPRYVVLDAAGLHIQHGRAEVVVPWPEIVALGLGYQVPPAEGWKIPVSQDGVKDLAQEYLAGKVQEALQISDKRRIALEIYPSDPAAKGRYPKLAPYWKRDVPPVAGLPDWLWRFPLPPVVSIGQAVERGARTVAPTRWLGWFLRPWSESEKPSSESKK